MRFLVVDDDDLSRELLTLLLEAEGYAVDATSSGDDAVARLAAGSREVLFPDVILADMQMPGLSGAALAVALRAELRGREVLLLAMSGSRPEDAKLAGFDGFLLKPFSISQLRSVISASGVALEASVPGPSMPALETGDIDTSGSASIHNRLIEAAHAIPAGPDVLDEDIFRKMRALMPPEQLGQMYALCAGDAKRRIAHMQELAATGDDAQYRASAHAVKGGAGMIGARELYQLSAAAERDGLEPGGTIPGTNGVTATLMEMSLACDRLERILGERTRE